MFGDAKSRGLNIEDTRLTHPRKLALLMALVALAIVWAGRTAATLIRHGSPKRKSHGYFAQSWFRIGFDRIRNLLSSDSIAAIDAWRRLRSRDPYCTTLVGYANVQKEPPRPEPGPPWLAQAVPDQVRDLGAPAAGDGCQGR